LGIAVVDAHAHFMTYNTVKAWLSRGDTLDRLERRARTRTDMEDFELPHEEQGTGQLWADEMDRYGVSAMGFMVGQESWHEFLDARRRFPGRFMGYANVNPADEGAVELVRRAGEDGFQGIKLYPSSWADIHAYDDVCYPVYGEAQRQGLLVILHFGITIGTRANLLHGNPLDIQRPAQEFPDIDFMIAHFGAGFFRELLLLQYQADNVYMDSSGSNSWMRYLPYDLDLKKIFEKAITAGGPEKVIFGTDSTFFPRGFRLNILEEQHHAVKSLCSQSSPCLTEDEVDLIFHENILRLTGFEPRSYE